MEKTVLTKKEWKKAKKEAKKYIRDSEEYKQAIIDDNKECLALVAMFGIEDAFIDGILGKNLKKQLPGIVIGMCLGGIVYSSLSYVERELKVNKSVNKAMKEQYILEGSK